MGSRLDEGAIHISGSQDASRRREGVARESARVARSIQSLVVLGSHRRDAA